MYCEWIFIYLNKPIFIRRTIAICWWFLSGKMVHLFLKEQSNHLPCSFSIFNQQFFLEYYLYCYFILIIILLLQVKKRVGESIEILEALATEDRDLERLNKFLYSKSSTQIPVNSLKQLIACSLIHNPFIRYSIQGNFSYWNWNKCIKVKWSELILWRF